MNIFAGCRGRVFVIDNGNTPAGFYSFNPPLSSDQDSPILLHWADLTDNDIVLPQVTLASTKLLYVFSPQFGRVNVAGSLLLGTQDVGNAASLTALLAWFNTNRTSESGVPVTLSMPGKNVCKVHITGLSVGQVDADLHIQQFAISGLVADLPGAGGAGGAAGGGAAAGGAGGIPGSAAPDYSALQGMDDSAASLTDGSVA